MTASDKFAKPLLRKYIEHNTQFHSYGFLMIYFCCCSANEPSGWSHSWQSWCVV